MAFNKELHSNSFLNKITQIILDNLSNEQFGVETLAKIYGISRSHLFKKIRRATGKSASKYIRDIKLEEALKQLKNKDLTISEIAYNVGFSSHAYFDTCFKEYFGYTPSEVKAKKELALELSTQNLKGQTTIKRSWLTASIWVMIVLVLGVLIANTINKTKIDKEKTIAVIRFQNMTNNADNQIFADGLGEEIINSLSKVHQLKVTARNSSFQFSKEDDVTRISELIDVNYVLEGSVRKEDNIYRITTQLIDASDGYHLWSETYDRKQKDILFLQEEIARVVAHQLEVQLTEKEDKAIRSRITSDTLAYHLYNESIKSATSNKIVDIKKAVELMNRAIQSDSTFALAHARIVDLYRQNNFVGDTDYNVTTQLMQLHVDKALKLDPSLAEAYIAQGYLEGRKQNFAKAMHAFETAVELAPNEPRAHFALTGTYIVFNRFKEGYVQLVKAFELDPLNPRISLMAAQYFYYNKRDFEKGVKTLENSISAYPDNDLAKCHLAMYNSSLPKGDLVGTFKAYFEMYKSTPDERRVLNWLAHTCNWLDLKPMSEMLNNKMRLNHPKNIHTFQNMYVNNGMHGRFTDNIDLVKFWSKDQNLNIFDQVNYLAESYIRSDNPALAKQIIEDSIPQIKDKAFLKEDEKYNSRKIARLDIIEKYLIALRELNKTNNIDQYIDMANGYIESELKKLSDDQILDYRYELRLKLISASVNDDVKLLIKIFDQAFFKERHRSWMFDELMTLARYHRFKNDPEFIGFLEKVTKETHIQRDIVIAFLKQEGFWETSWNSKL